MYPGVSEGELGDEGRVRIHRRHDFVGRLALRERHGVTLAVLATRRSHDRDWAVTHVTPEATV